ncbi:hypothetical protein K435DRAFT_778274 [Dendrothele bispora CBS 962.96]|uniref:Xylanolytic transcriptional activator regulatory domain-containing protein n=1 Tax=Dendrothele bispora (strain CBS 962.96) TaxID=1314807 RepID=A0A4S8M466_DENBC|nr:hypothetical protein K435DRAFT_778274 [Dendrothele bispora CBS 962.96]
MPDKICSSCILLETSCTHNKVQQKRGPKPGTVRTAASLPVGTLVSNILDRTKFEPFEVPDDEEIIRRLLVKLANRVRELENELKNYQMTSVFHSGEETSTGPLISTMSSQPEPQSTESESDEKLKTLDHDVEKLSRQFSQFSFGLPSKAHFGESSTYKLLFAAMDHAKGMSGTMSSDWGMIINHIKRPQYWTTPSWLLKSMTVIPRSSFEFPPAHLLHQFVNAYFVQQEVYSPLLHRPTFEKGLAQGLHLRDDSFGAVVLAVCALGARIGSPSPIKDRPGDKWFNQIRLENFFFRETLELHHLQLYCLCLSYLYANAEGVDDSWLISGLSIRRSHEKGIHRRYAQNAQRPTIEGELWKRAFWMLIFHEARLVTVFGRPAATTIQDFDLGPLIECDDEYWEPKDHTQESFSQPSGKPSTTSYWNCYMKLMEIYGLSTLTIYSARRSEIGNKMGVGSLEWYEKVVMQLDSALNKWLDSVPEHLQWDKKHDSQLFFSQSALLYSIYYWIQIQVHRPFIPRPGQDKSVLSFPSLAICTNAARSCIRVCESHCRRAFTQWTGFFIPLLNSAIILALNMARSSQLKLNFDPAKEMRDIYIATDLMRLYELRYPLAGRFVDIVNIVIVATGNLPRLPITVPATSPQFQEKTSQNSTNNPSQSSVTPNARPDVDMTLFPFNSDSPPRDLPFYSSELGELPVHRNSPGSFETHTSAMSDHSSSSVHDPQSGTDWNTALNRETSSLPYFNVDLAVTNNAPSETSNLYDGLFSSITGSLPTGDAEAQKIWQSYRCPSQDWDSFVAGIDQLLNPVNVGSNDGTSYDPFNTVW